MKKFVLVCMVVFSPIMMACGGVVNKKVTKYLSTDSTLLFTFVGDSLYIDTADSGCGLEVYHLDVITSNSKGTDIVYKGVEWVLDDIGEHEETHTIRLSKYEFGGHWFYLIKFDNDKPIETFRVSFNYP
jgi:hypothetical protein